MKKQLPYFIRIHLPEPEEMFLPEEQDETLLALEYTTEYFLDENIKEYSE